MPIFVKWKIFAAIESKRVNDFYASSPCYYKLAITVHAAYFPCIDFPCAFALYNPLELNSPHAKLAHQSLGSSFTLMQTGAKGSIRAGRSAEPQMFQYWFIMCLWKRYEFLGGWCRNGTPNEFHLILSTVVCVHRMPTQQT